MLARRLNQNCACELPRYKFGPGMPGPYIWDNLHRIGLGRLVLARRRGAVVRVSQVRLRVGICVSPESQITGALGAALLARDELIRV